jgi:tripartite-type tricarboxylate transporter receptor subunit TctC
VGEREKSAIVHALLAVAVFGTSVLTGAAAHAQSWPAKPARILVPFAPGGGADIQARLLAKSFNEGTGQTFVVDNRTGAGGLIAAELTVQSPSDGYTMLLTTATIAVNTTLFGKRMRFSAEKDLAPITWLSSTPLMLVVHPSVPARSVKELVALGRNRPGNLTSAVNTVGSTSHLSAEMLKQLGRIESAIVPFKGGSQAILSVISGECDLLFATGPVATPQLNSGKVRGLAVTTPKRSSAFPDLPTMNTFFPGFESDNWYAMFFPAGTSRDIVTRINSLIAKAFTTHEIREFMKREVLDPVVSTPEELSALLKRETAKYAQVITKANIKLE